MPDWVKTEELKKLLPSRMSCYEIEALTGVNAKRIWNIIALRTEFTDYYLADRICTGLDRIADFHTLAVIENREHHRKHGMAAYNREGCRCSVCKEAKRLADYRYRVKRAKIKSRGHQKPVQPKVFA